MDEWHKISIPAGSKLLKNHRFTFMWSGSTFFVEIDESNDGAFMGHAEHSIDKSFVIESVTGKSIKDCLEKLMQKIQARQP